MRSRSTAAGARWPTLRSPSSGALRSPARTADRDDPTMSPVRPTVQVIGSRLDPEAYRLRDFLTRIAQPHEWFEAGSPEADRLLLDLGLTSPPLPVLVDGEDVHTAATVELIVEAWDQRAPPKRSH